MRTQVIGRARGVGNHEARQQPPRRVATFCGGLRVLGAAPRWKRGGSQSGAADHRKAHVGPGHALEQQDDRAKPPVHAPEPGGVEESPAVVLERDSDKKAHWLLKRSRDWGRGGGGYMWPDIYEVTFA